MTTLRIQPETFGFTLVLGALAALPSMSIDMTAPTLPVLEASLKTSISTVTLTITLFMAGFAFGQLSAGTLSDHYGRKPILVAGLSLYVATGIGTAVAPSISFLIVLRMVQGIGAGTGTVLAFAMIRDLYIGDRARAKRSYVSAIFSLGPMIAPALGARLILLGGWRTVHGFLPAVGSVLLLTVIWGVTESRQTNASKDKISLSTVITSYGEVLARRSFQHLMLINALSFASMFAYVSGSSFVFVNNLGLSAPVAGELFSCSATGLIIGALTSGFLSRREIAAGRLVNIGLLLSATSAIALAIGTGGPVAVITFLAAIHFFCRGLIAPNAQHMALELTTGWAGIAAALLGVSQILTGTLVSAVVGLLLPLLGSSAMTGTMALLTLASVGVWQEHKSLTRT